MGVGKGERFYIVVEGCLFCLTGLGGPRGGEKLVGVDAMAVIAAGFDGEAPMVMYSTRTQGASNSNRQ